MKRLLILLSCALLPLAAQARDESKAQIVTMNAKPAECISPVHIYKIDGKNTFVSPQGFELDPGAHTMNGRAAINQGNCPSINARSKSLSIPDLKGEFEAGRTYYVGLDHSSKDRNEWALVVWKVE